MAKAAHVPRIFVLAGTNGAGKSSIGGATIRAHGGHYFNPDEAAARIRQAQPQLSVTQANSAAWHEGRRLLQEAMAHKLDYSFETTLGGRSLASLLAQAADGGHAVYVWYVGLASPEQHLARVRARVRHGGHDIPEADIRRRFDQSRLQLIDLLPRLTELRVYDNSTEADPKAGQAPLPRLLLHTRRRPASESAGPTLEVIVPVGPQALGETPDWAKPLVLAAYKLSQPARKPPITPENAKAARPGKSPPARSA